MLDMELWKDEWSDDEDYYLRYSFCPSRIHNSPIYLCPTRISANIGTLCSKSIKYVQ